MEKQITVTINDLIERLESLKQQGYKELQFNGTLVGVDDCSSSIVITTEPQM